MCIKCLYLLILSKLENVSELFCTSHTSNVDSIDFKYQNRDHFFVFLSNIVTHGFMFPVWVWEILRVVPHVEDVLCILYVINQQNLQSLGYNSLATGWLKNCRIASQGENAICALQINYKVFSFPLDKSCRNEQTINSLP